MAMLSKDVIFNFGLSVFSKVRVRPVVIGLRAGGGSHSFDGNNDDLDYLNSTISSTVSSSIDELDQSKEMDRDDEANDVPIILSNGQWVVFGLIVYPPKDWKNDKSMDELSALFESYKDRKSVV